MANQQEFKHQARRAAIIVVALGACLIFGIVVLASGDWLPGGIIVAASSVGVVREIPIIRGLCSTGSHASPPNHRAVK